MLTAGEFEEEEATRQRTRTRSTGGAGSPTAGQGNQSQAPFPALEASNMGGIAGGLDFEPLAAEGEVRTGPTLLEAPRAKAPSTYSNGTPLDPFPVGLGDGGNSSGDAVDLQWLGGGAMVADGSATRPGNDTGLSTAVAEFLAGLPDLGFMVK